MNKLNLCPISGEKLLPIIDLGAQPIFMGTTESHPASDMFYQMSWGATSTGIVHLMTRVPLDKLYAQSHNSGLVGQVWLNHHYQLSEFIAKYQPNRICEIGGGHGILCQNYASHSDFCAWDIYEPNAKKSHDPRVKVKSEFFTPDTNINRADCFVHSHLLEHLYDHSSILKTIHSSLPSKGLMIFSIPNMNKMVQGGYINALNFEHVTYLPEDLIDYLLIREGFKVLEKQYYLDDHSIFYCCEKSKPFSSLKYYSPKNTLLIEDFFNNQFKEIGRINDILDSTYAKSKIYLFGAHIFSQFYINNGLKASRIESILDNDNTKQSLRLYGTDLKVEAPQKIEKVDQPVVILKAGAYRSEITKQLHKLNANVTIID